MTRDDEAWIAGHIDRIERHPSRKRKRKSMAVALLRGLGLIWDHPEILACRYADLLTAEPDSYRTAAMGRVIDLQPDLHDIRGLFAAVCLNSTGLWSAQIDKARPALDLIAARVAGEALAADAARVVLAYTQPGEGKQGGRPPAGMFEESRDIGLANMRGDFARLEDLAADQAIDLRELKRICACWSPYIMG